MRVDVWCDQFLNALWLEVLLCICIKCFQITTIPGKLQGCIFCIPLCLITCLDLFREVCYFVCGSASFLRQYLDIMISKLCFYNTTFPNLVIKDKIIEFGHHLTTVNIIIHTTISLAAFVIGVFDNKAIKIGPVLY